jgi:adenylate kinase family enzyme
MQRVVVVGAGGSGKTVLALRLSALFGLPVAHLDGLFYDRDFNPVPAEEFAAAQERLIRAERWVADGNYAATLPLRLGRADTVVFLDLPGWVCLAGPLRRPLAYHGGQHPASGVCDRLDGVSWPMWPPTDGGWLRASRR